MYQQNNSERPVDALAIKKVTDSLSDNLKSRDASASKRRITININFTIIIINTNAKNHHKTGKQIINCEPDE